MTKVILNPGICGHKTIISVDTVSQNTVKAVLETSCPNITGIPDDMLLIDPLIEMTPRGELPNKLKKYIPHTSCAFTAALLKAAEAEAGLALKKNVSITFTEPE